MLGDVGGTECKKLIGDISKTIVAKLEIFITKPLKAVEYIAKNIDY